MVIFKTMNLEELKKKVKEFDEQAGFDKTEFKKLLEMMQKELDILKSNPEDKAVVNHQLTDLLILMMQIAYRYDTDFDSELEKWFDKSKKYLRS